MKRLIFIGLILSLIGCQNAKTNSIEKIKDETTKVIVPVVDPTGFTVVEHLYDSMYLGNHEYAGNLVIDPSYYTANNFKRGEVVYYDTPKTGHKNVARVVGLPGEKIEIQKGQLYIDDKRLDAFYSKAMNNGISDFNTYKEKMKANGNKVIGEKDWKNYFKRTLKPIIVKENEVFVLADNSWRAWDSFTVGPLPQKNVIGKVLGIPGIPSLNKEYVKTHAKIGQTQPEVTIQFGQCDQTGSDSGVDIWMYDETKNGFTYDRSLKTVAFKDIKNDNVMSQLFVYFRDGKTFMYSYFYKGENGEVWEYTITPNQTPQDSQVSQTTK